jgi:Tol biopolymer transport system component
MADWQIYNHHELFSTPIAGGQPVKLNDDLPADGKVIDFSLSPDGSRAVYLVKQNAVSFFELYAIPVAGGDTYKLNDPLVADGNVYDFEISPDSSRVVYVADQDTHYVDELYSVSLLNPLADAIKLNPVMVANGDVSYYNIKISPDSSRVAYLADQDTDGMNELYAVPIEGGTAVKLNEPLANSIDLTTCRYLDCFKFSPDSNYVVYQVQQDTVSIRELYSALITETGSVVAKLNDPINTVGRNVISFEISPDGSRVVYNANVTEGVNEELFSVPIQGGTVSKLNSALVPGGSVATYAISHDSQYVVYVANQQTFAVWELYKVPLQDGAITKLNPPIVAGGTVYLNFYIAPDNNHVVYRAEQETDNVGELFVSFEEVPEAEYTIFLPVVVK